MSHFQREGRVEAGVMTSSTHSGEGKEEETTKEDGVSSSAVLRDPEHEGTHLPIAHSAFSPRVTPTLSCETVDATKEGTFLSVTQPTHAMGFRHFRERDAFLLLPLYSFVW